jgi:hypothetical protein
MNLSFSIFALSLALGTEGFTVPSSPTSFIPSTNKRYSHYSQQSHESTTTQLFVSSPPSSSPLDKTKNNNKEVINQIEELTTAFEQVQETIRVTSQQYDAKLTEYEDKIQVLQLEVQASSDTVQDKEKEIKKLESEMEEVVKMQSKVKKDKSSSKTRASDQKKKIEASNKKIESKWSKRVEELEAKSKGQLKTLEKAKEEELKAKDKLLKETVTSVEKDWAAQIREIESDRNAKKKALEKATKEVERVKSESEKMVKAMEKAKEEDLKEKDKALEDAKKSVEKEWQAKLTGLETLKNKDLKVKEELLQDARVSYDREGGRWKKELGIVMKEKQTIVSGLEKLIEDLKQSADQNEVQLTAKIEELKKEKLGLNEKLAAEVENQKVLENKLKNDEGRLKAEKEMEELAMKNKEFSSTIENLTRRLEQDKSADVERELRNELIDAKRIAANEMYEFKFKMESTIKEKDELIEDMEAKLDLYEEERRSLRKLTGLGLKRVGSVVRFRRSRKTEEKASK